MVLVVGVDSGATKTTCAIVGDDGEVRGVGVAGPSNYQIVGIESARNNVLTSIKMAMLQANLQKAVFDIGCFGMGGLDTKHDYDVISGFIKPLGVVRKYIIVDDMVVAFYAVTAGKPGVAVVAGTGSIAYGMNEKGKEARSSGWGWLMGDEGSAFDIARSALVAAARAHDGRGPKTILMELIRKQLGLKNYEDVISAIHLKSIVSTEIASMAPLVTLAAQRGDRVAIGILKEAGKELGIAVVAVAEKLGMKEEKVIVGGSGGVFKAGKFVWKPFKRFVRASMPNAIFKKPVPDPIDGAVILGLKKQGVPITDEFAARIRKSIHEKENPEASSA